MENKNYTPISVDDKLPELDEKDRWNFSHNITKKVIVWEGEETYFGRYNRNIEEWTVYGRSGDINVTHWLPIPELQK